MTVQITPPKQTESQVPSQESIERFLLEANDENATELFQDLLHRSVRAGLLGAMQSEVDLLCGPKYHPVEGAEFRRAGSERGYAFLAGQREEIRRPRVRSVEGEEIQLETYRAAHDQRSLFDQVVESVAAGLPVRGVENCNGGAVKRSQASRMWVEKSREELELLRSRSLVAEDWIGLWIDGVHIGQEQCVIVAIGLHADGTKEVLDFESGASESAEVCNLLLERVVERGFGAPEGQRLLVIRDGSTALARAIRRIWPDAVQQECLVHCERNVNAKLPQKAKEESARLFNKLRAAEGAEAGQEAFDELKRHVGNYNQEALQALEEREEALLAFHRLNVPATLNVTFLSTNIIENVFRNWREQTHHIKRWRTVKSDMVSRWSASGLLAAERGFRRVRGHGELGKLAEALKATPSPAACA